MYYQTLVKNLFNDMHHFMNGTKVISLEDLIDNYQEEPLFLAFMGNLDQVVALNYNDVMKECYSFYKKYCGRELTDDEWDSVVAQIKEFDKSRDNVWCRGLMLALLNLLDLENKEWKANREKQKNSHETNATDDSEEESENQELESVA